jgi:hypothetical protein
VVYWDEDELKDLLIGQADGYLRIFTNVGTENEPSFDGGTLLQVGEPGSKVDIDVGSRATPIVADWNNDGNKDLVAGALDGRFNLFVNEGTDNSPDFRTEQFVQEDGYDLTVPTIRSSPVVTDLDDDGRKDILTGDTNGRLLLYSNVGTDETPVFSGYILVQSDSIPIDLAGSARSRPFVCDWTGDGLLDVLIGGSDGLVHLYQGIDEVGLISRKVPPSVPRAGRLLTAYPNPFNPVVTIPFELSGAGHVSLSVYDIRGRRVSILADGQYKAGQHRVIWQGKDNSGRNLPSGVYIIHFRTGETSGTGKINLMR